MKPVVYLSNRVSNDYRSNLFFIFDFFLTTSFDLTDSFRYFDDNVYPILTGFGRGEVKFIEDNKPSNYALILDASKINASNFNLKIALKSDFIIIIGEVDSELSFLVKNLKIDLTVFPFVYNDLITRSSDANLNLISFDSLSFFYERWSESNSPVDELEVLLKIDDDLSFWQKSFDDIGINLRGHFINPNNYLSLLEGCAIYYGKGGVSDRVERELLGSNKGEVGSISFFKKLINEKIKANILDLDSNFSSKKESDIVNIVCFNPTYLFKDLVNRFVEKGCVHSDFPLPNAKAYIWMRPQEIWHYDFLLNNKSDKEISENYKNNFKKINEKNLDFSDIKERSVAIHHGTCYEPLYQFNYTNLAKSLYTLKKVVGVCEFEECYGPSHIIANKNNFVFVPIGYDHTLFNESFWKTDVKLAEAPLKIGFVGRAYGTTNKSHLRKSKLAEPKGYRKGGDLCLDILLRLKAIGVNFELHILGQNWEELIEQLERYGIHYKYYARDKNITYVDYPKVYSLMDVLLISARCEGGPVSAIEALSLGVNVVSTDVGVVKYLNDNLNTRIGCRSFEYDKKWHIADIELAVEHLKNIFDKEITAEDRASIRNSVLPFTTDNWVEKILNEVK